MQTLDLDQNIYLLLVLGMVAVGAHAYTLFNQQLRANEPSSRWQFLTAVPIQLVTSRSRYRMGFAVYLILFEFVYIVLASSSSLVLMMYQFSGREELTGALSESVSPDGVMPILASTAMILLSQIRPFAHVEITLRQMAHRIAQIPEGLKTTKQRLANYLDGKDGRKALQVIRDQPVKVLFQIIPGESASGIAGSLRDTLCKIELLYENTLGSSGVAMWDAEETEEIILLFRSVEGEISQLDADVCRLFTAQNPTEQNDAVDPLLPGATGVQIAQLLKRAQQIEERLLMLMCLLMINQPDAETGSNTTMNRLVRTVQEPSGYTVLNVSLLSTLLGGVVCSLALFLYQGAETFVKNEIRQNPYTYKAPYGDYLEYRLKSNESQAALYLFDGMGTSERAAATSRWNNIFSETSTDLADSLEETLLIILTFLPATLLALSLRQNQIRMKRWPVHDVNRPANFPVSHYAAISIAAALGTTSVVFIYYFLRLALWPALKRGIDLLSLEIIEPFFMQLGSIFLFTLLGIICACFALRIADLMKLSLSHADEVDASLHDSQSSYRTNQGLWLTPNTLLLSCVFFALFSTMAALTTSLYLGQLSTGWDFAQSFAGNLLGFFSFYYALYRVLAGLRREAIPENVNNSRAAIVEHSLSSTLPRSKPASAASA